MTAAGSAPVPRVDVALMMPDFGGGGAERMMARLATSFAASGRSVELVVCSPAGPFRDDVGPDVRVVDLDRAGVLAALPAVVRYLRERRPRVVLVTLDHMTVVASWARALAGVPLRLVVRQANNPTAYVETSWRARLVLRALRDRLRHADAVVTGSQGVADDLAAWARLPSELVHVVGNPVVDAALADLAEEPVDHPFFAEAGPPILLAAGRLTPQKDFMTLMRAFAIARTQRPLRLVVLGEGGERGALEAFVRDHELQDVVSLPGFVANPFAFMRRADAFVLSSAWEGLPAVLIQALACGCPVVATDCPSGPREVLDGGRYGPLVPVGDAPALAEAILSTLDDPPAPEALRARASTYGVDRSVRRYADVLWPDAQVTT